jgi:hypothetical protein
MSNITHFERENTTLPDLIDRAALALSNARTSAEVLEARDIAGMAYDAAKKAARLAEAKGAHDGVVAAAHRAQADALEIEALAKRRLAYEYDEAQENGGVATRADGAKLRDHIPGENKIATVRELGLTSKAIHEARLIRDAEESDPGIVNRTLQEALDNDEEPTRAKVKRAVLAKTKRRRQPKPNYDAPGETQHDRDLRMLLGVWEASCDSARGEFLRQVTELAQ